MKWLLVALDDDTLAAVLDDARVRSLEGSGDFILLTPATNRWGDERSDDDGYLATLDKCVGVLRAEGVKIEHETVPGDDLRNEIVDACRNRSIEGVVIAHHNPSNAIPDPEAFDDAIREELGVPLDVISLE
ncbi:MAG: hypothetical protein HY827_08245 [Actinobacteria bacterium]|nr:hypothetical protein [Actinomycetota bacterium]